MRINNLTILAIAPGTREIGWAILQSGVLLHCGVRTITKRHFLTVAKIESAQFIKTLVKRYAPECLAIEKRHLRQRSSGVFAAIAQEVKAIAEVNHLKVSEYVSTEVRRRLCQSEKGTKKNSSQLLAHRFPELQNYLKHENKWAELYYMKMFDAVGVGVICQQDLTENQSKLESR